MILAEWGWGVKELCGAKWENLLCTQRYRMGAVGTCKSDVCSLWFATLIHNKHSINAIVIIIIEIQQMITWSFSKLESIEPKQTGYLHFSYTCQDALLQYIFYLWSFDIFSPHKLYSLTSCLWVLTEQSMSS